MHIYKPEFVKHDGGSPIFSVDCHPDGTRMATAGGDQKVKLWNLEALKKREVEADPNVPRVLATLSDHFNTVNCVRFSKNGRFLASGSTDSNVFLYEKRPGPGRAQFGSTDEPNVENWVNCQALRGHVSDVIDIAWAPDDSMLASCSLDNLIIVWDPATGQRVTTLKGHTSFVKGVAWDPIGKFLATQADDKSCIVWRVDDWSVVSKITEPYQSSMGATFSLRLSWSPDGKAVTTCNSYKKPSHTASVLERGDWGSKFDFVGHKGPVVTVRFSPALFKAEEKQDAPPHTVIACGSQDCKMTVWATNRPKPVCIVKTCFTQSVVDLCWSPDGYSLIACSTDGTVAIFTFDEKELGVAMSDEAKVGFLSETYGDLRRRVGPILEDPSLLRFEQQHGTPGKPPLPQPAVVANGAAKAPKRIAPQAMGAPPPAGKENASTNGTPAPAPVVNQVAPTAELQLETRASDGRRRIMPVPQGGTAAAPMPMPMPMPAFPVAQAPAGSPHHSALKRRIEPTQMGAPGGAGFEQNKRVTYATGGAARGGDSRGFPPSEGGGGFGGGGPTYLMLAPGSSGAAQVPTRPAPVTLHCQLDGGDEDPFAAAAAAAASAEAGEPEAVGPTMLEARNSERHSDVVCSTAGIVRWTDRCSESRATHIAGTKTFAAVFFENCTVQLYTPAGRRAMPPLVTPGRAAFVSASGGRLVAVTGDCSLIVWDLGVPGQGDAGDERERRPAPVGTSGASRAADGGREARQVRLADRAVRGRARVRVPPQAQIVGARRGSVVPPVGVYHPTATPGGGGRLGPRRAPRASSRRRESGGRHGTLRASQRRRPRAPPRDWAPPRVPPRGGGHAGIAGGVPGVAEGVLEAPRGGGSRGPRARAAPGDVHVAARAPQRRWWGRGWGRGGKRRWVGGHRGWGFEEEGAARGDCVAGARHEQGVAAARGRGQRAPRGGEEEE